jgi:hypothetical protein
MRYSLIRLKEKLEPVSEIALTRLKFPHRNLKVSVSQPLTQDLSSSRHTSNIPSSQNGTIARSHYRSRLVRVCRFDSMALRRGRKAASRSTLCDRDEVVRSSGENIYLQADLRSIQCFGALSPRFRSQQWRRCYDLGASLSGLGCRYDGRIGLFALYNLYPLPLPIDVLTFSPLGFFGDTEYSRPSLSTSETEDLS